MKIDLEELLRAQILDEVTAQSIRDYYRNKNQTPRSNRLVQVISIAGICLFGLGLLLIIGYNWDVFSKGIKLLIACLPLLIGQGLGVYSLWYKNNNPSWTESAAVAILMGIGVAIALVSQIYHIDGSLPEFLFAWILLCIPLIYLFDSGAVSLAIWLGIGWYILAGGSHLHAYSPLLFILACVPWFIWKMRNGENRQLFVFHQWIIPIVFVILQTNLLDKTCAPLAIIFFLGLFLILNYSGNLFFEHAPLWTNGFRIIGFLGILSVGFLMTFHFYWESMAKEKFINCFTGTSELIALVYLLALIYLVWQFIKKSRMSMFIPELWMGWILLILFLIGQVNTWLALISANLMILLTSAFWIREGIQKEKLGLLNFGILALSILVICRFFENDISFIWRGLLFMSLGILCFVLNYLIIRKRKAIHE